MRKVVKSLGAAAGILLTAGLAVAAPTPVSTPSYGLGTTQFISTIGPGGVPAGGGQPAISSSTQVLAGILTATQLANGDIQVSIVQGFNDNTYGTNADPLWGKQGHKFNDLVGSDKAEFKFADSKGNTVLDFDVDYVSQVKSSPVQIAPGLFATYASGYGTLGVLGGDGKVLSGDASNIKSIDTTITDNLNNPKFISASTLVNSPTDPAWNKADGFTVVISAAAFGANGFGSVSIPDVHDSPARPFANPVPLPPSVYSLGALMGLMGVVKLYQGRARLA